MTVRQLMECLKHCPEDGEVLIYGEYAWLELKSPTRPVDVTVSRLKGKDWVLLSSGPLPVIADGRDS
jgi:nicotinamide riboside transporter PnuC